MAIALRDYLSVSNIYLRDGERIRIVIYCNPDEDSAIDGAVPGDKYDDSYSVLKSIYLFNTDFDDRFTREYVDVDSSNFTPLDCSVSSVFVDSTGLTLYLHSPYYSSNRWVCRHA